MVSIISKLKVCGLVNSISTLFWFSLYKGRDFITVYSRREAMLFMHIVLFHISSEQIRSGNPGQSSAKTESASLLNVSSKIKIDLRR